MIPLVMVISVLSLAFAVYLARQVLAADQGTPQMQEIASAIKEGAEAFLRRQNGTIFLIGIFVAVLIFVLYAFVRPANPNDPTTPFNMALATTLAFCFGALCSGVSGYVGMFVSIRANLRTASAVRTSLNRALQIALRGGAVSGLFVVAMSLLGVGGLFVLLRAFGVAVEKIPLLIVGYGFGASLVALFAQLGGGIYTKAADVGADLVGKVEAGIPEDDPGGGARQRGRAGERALRRRHARRDALPAGRACLRPGRLDHRGDGGAHRRARGPDARPQPGLLHHLRPRARGLRRRHALAPLRPGAAERVAPLLPLRVGRDRDGAGVRLHHAVLHRVPVSAGARD